MTRTTRPARTGFTLIEMLVVVAIIGILISILGVAYQKTVDGNRRSVTKSELNKLQKSLDAEYDRVVKKCALDSASAGTIPPEIMKYADGDENRGRAIWTALQLRRQLPDTVAEALSPVSVVQTVTAAGFSIVAGTPPANAIYTLQPLEIFKIEFAGVTLPLPTGAPINGAEESGAVLYVILAKKTVSGGGAMASAADDLTATTQTKVTLGGKEFPVFADKWGNPIGFRRWYGVNNGDLAEVQKAPYVDAQKTGNLDPIDPRNLVNGWKLTSGQPNTTKINEMKAFGFTGANRLATAYSIARDKTDPADDLYGYTSRTHGK